MGRRYSRSPSPIRRRRSRRGGDLPTSLLVRNLRHDCRPEDLRGPFGEFGPVKDIYLPRDYYTGVEDQSVKQPRGFGFVQYIDPDDAAEAKHEMDGQVLLGRELTVVFAEENRKKPSEMRARDRVRVRSSSRYSRSPRYGRSFSPSRRYASRSPDYSPSPRGRRYSRSPVYYSPSPRGRRYSRSPVYYSPSPRGRRYSRSISPRGSRYRERSYTRSPYLRRSWSGSPDRSY